MRVSIDRIVIDAAGLDPRDAEGFRRRLQEEIAALLERGGVPDARSAARVSGELPPTPAAALPRAVAEQVVRALGGEGAP